MSKRLSFSIAVNLLTENFKKGTNTVKNSLRSMQMQVIAFAAALGASGLGISGLLSRFRDVARETSRVSTALKNVSDGTKGFADNLRFISDLAKKYGMEITALTGNFAGFTASATQANMPMEQQKKVFESLSRASTAFGLSAQQTDGVFLALSQMMGKGKVSMEELRKQMGEKLPIAVQAMAKALGVSIAQMEKLIGSGKVMSADVLPKFADALNEMIPNIDIDNLETSLNRLSNVFTEIVDSSGFKNKYKALIDGSTSLLESAGKNIRNIIAGIVAAIGFVVTNGLTKVYRGYAATGKRIVANANTTHDKLRDAIAARFEAEKRLEELKLQHAQAVGRAQVTLAKRVEQQKQLLSARTATVNIAHENAKVAAAQAAAIKSMGAWGTAWATISGSAKKLMVALKSMWNTFAPAIIMSAIIAILGHFRNLYIEAKRVKSIFSDYKKEAETIGNTQEVTTLQAQLAIMNDKTKSQKEINSAQEALQKMLGVEKKSQKEINELVGDRIKLLKANAEADFYAGESTSYTDKNRKLIRNAGLKDDQITSLVAKREEYKASGKRVPFSNEVAKVWKENTGKDFGYNVSAMIALVDEYIENSKVISDADAYLKAAVNDANKINSTQEAPQEAPDDKAQRAAEKRLEALRKLDEEDRKRQIEKQKFDLDLQQKAIDLMDDSFEKRTEQTILNLKKEKLAVDEASAELLKKQNERAKTEFVSIHGTDQGFGDHFKKLQDNNFKNKDGGDVMPEGLRPDDIAKRVSDMTAAAQAAQRKGLNDINKDLSAMLREQQLMFASDLDKKLADLDAYYNEQLIKAGNNAELIAQIESNRKREKLEVTADDNIRKLDFNEELESERAAGMESIGMTELVEEKKLEITKKYLQLKIEALQELADAGDEDAGQQIRMYQESLNKLNMQKPAESLKALADKAIFERIRKGFESVGDSAEEAEKKTISLLGSISKKAGMIANMTSELQSVFGGMNSGLDEALSAVGNIASGFAQGGIIGGIAAVAGEAVKLFGKASEAAARHKKELKEIEDARLASQRAYNILLLEQNLLLKEAVSIFGEKQIKRAVNALNNYKESLEKIDTGGLADQKIVTGHQKTGMFGWGKGKDVYGGILDVYPEIIKKNGEIDEGLLRIILDTREMSDETRAYLENLIELKDFAASAADELKNYLQSTFGSLGADIMTSLENAIKDKGVDAWESFGESGAKVLEQLGKQIAYELFFADKFKDLQGELEAIYGSDKSEEDIAREAMDLVGKFYQNIEKDMDLAQDFLENWKKEAEKHGLEAWKPEDSATQDSTKGYSTAMDQDTGGAILGRITGIHESILEVKSMMSAVNYDTAKCLTQSVAIGDELKKHTGIFYEMQQIQVKSYRLTEKVSESLSVLGDMKDGIDAINKNTKGLAPK